MACLSSKNLSATTWQCALGDAIGNECSNSWATSVRLDGFGWYTFACGYCSGRRLPQSTTPFPQLNLLLLRRFILRLLLLPMIWTGSTRALICYAGYSSEDPGWKNCKHDQQQNTDNSLFSIIMPDDPLIPKTEDFPGTPSVFMSFGQNVNTSGLKAHQTNIRTP